MVCQGQSNGSSLFWSETKGSTWAKVCQDGLVCLVIRNNLCTVLWVRYLVSFSSLSVFPEFFWARRTVSVAKCLCCPSLPEWIPPLRACLPKKKKRKRNRRRLRWCNNAEQSKLLLLGYILTVTCGITIFLLLEKVPYFVCSFFRCVLIFWKLLLVPSRNHIENGLDSRQKKSSRVNDRQQNQDTQSLFWN